MQRRSWMNGSQARGASPAEASAEETAEAPAEATEGTDPLA